MGSFWWPLTQGNSRFEYSLVKAQIRTLQDGNRTSWMCGSVLFKPMGDRDEFHRYPGTADEAIRVATALALERQSGHSAPAEERTRVAEALFASAARRTVRR